MISDSSHEGWNGIKSSYWYFKKEKNTKKISLTIRRFHGHFQKNFIYWSIFWGGRNSYIWTRAIKFHGRLSLLSIDLQLRIYSVSNTARFGLEKFLGYLPSVDGLTIEIGFLLMFLQIVYYRVVLISSICHNPGWT